MPCLRALSRRYPALLVAALGIPLLLAGCATSDRTASPATSDAPLTVASSEAPPSASAGANADAEPSAGDMAPLTLGPAVKAPRVTTTVAGHVATLDFQPGIGSGAVTEYQARVTAKGARPETGRLIDYCGAKGQEVVSCPLATQTRGTWDVWVRAVGKNSDSGWTLSTPIEINSCTAADARNGDCEVFDKGPGGGFVFYAAPWRESWGQYLEAAPPGWAGGSRDPSGPLCSSSELWGRVQTRTGLGTGAYNSIQIRTHCGEDSAPGIAAKYRGGGNTDWFLPSVWEQQLMYDRRSEIGGLTNDGELPNSYWSSERQGQYAYGYYTDLKAGDTHDYVMNKRLGIRPIRAF